MTDGQTVPFCAEMEQIEPKTNTDKFYRVFARGNMVCSHYGRNGTAGAFAVKTFPNDNAALRYAESAVRSKTSKGYRHIAGDTKRRFPLASPEDCLVAAAAHVAAKELAVTKEAGTWNPDAMKMFAGLLA